MRTRRWVSSTRCCCGCALRAVADEFCRRGKNIDRIRVFYSGGIALRALCTKKLHTAALNILRRALPCAPQMQCKNILHKMPLAKLNNCLNRSKSSESATSDSRSAVRSDANFCVDAQNLTPKRHADFISYGKFPARDAKGVTLRERRRVRARVWFSTCR
jgi:hypothetical protein